MKNNRIYRSRASVFPDLRAYMERPRINRLLKEAVQSPLVTVCAGTGYGKTQAVYSFLRSSNLFTSWLQISERDNIAARYWENYAGAVSLYNKLFGEKLYKLGFPDTEDKYSKYLYILENEFNPSEKYVRVLDDFYLIKDKTLLRFIEKIILNSLPNITTIIISRSEPEINILSLLSKGLVVSFNEDDLRFTEDETAKYYEFVGIPLSAQSVSNIHKETAGWAFAESLIGLSLKKAPSHESAALSAMKQNIFKMIENEVFITVSERLQRFLLKLPLIDYLATDLLYILAEDETLVEELTGISSFIRYDMFLNAYLIHHLFLAFLRQRQSTLTDDEKRGTYLKAAKWCNENGHTIDAISYYDKAKEYEAIIKIVYHMPIQLPVNQAAFIMEIYNNAPKEMLESIASYYIQRSRLLMSLGHYRQAADEIKERIEKFLALPPSDFNNRVLCGDYTSLGIISYLVSHFTDRFEFDKYLEKADHYYRLSPYEEYGRVTSIALTTWASKVSSPRDGAMEEYIETVSRAIPFVSHVLNGFMYGLDDLARGELFFYKGSLKNAEKFIRQSLSRAKERRQHEIKNRAVCYLLRIAFMLGDFNRIQLLMRELEAQLGEPEYDARFVTFDIISAWYYSALAQPQNAASWLNGDIDAGVSTFNVSYGNFIKTKFYFANKRYHELLSFLESENSLKSVLFGKVEMKVLEAVCYYRLRERNQALNALKDAYQLACADDIVAPFIEMGKEMRTLTGSALKDKGCDIPAVWLRLINRKASTYAKRLAYITAEYKKANNLDTGNALSTREKAVLHDLYHGLSRSEIAANQTLSVNTVKMLINSIYRKLEVDSAAEVIRVAVEQNLLK
jgi:LuxR family maltose regulon positive regulatory protein